MRNARVRYEVFCADPTPLEAPSLEVLGYTAGDVEARRVQRADDPDLFQPPRFGPPVDAQGKFRQPLPDEHGEVSEAIDRAEVCYVIACQKTEPADLGYLDAAAYLALDIARQRGGVVVDRTADIGYPLVAFERLRAEGLRVRDAVSLEEISDGDGVTLRTHGMAKYGQADFLLERFPFEHVELGRRLLYDNVCDYSAFRAPVLPGQTMGSSDYRLFFETAGDDLLRITDCHPERKEPLPGIERLLGSLLPLWEQQKRKEAADDAARARREAASRKKGARARAARKAGAKGRRQVKRAVKVAAKARGRAQAKAKAGAKAGARVKPKAAARGKPKAAAKGKPKAAAKAKPRPKRKGKR